MTTAINENSRWYHEPMVWLVWLLPAAVVVAGIGLLVVAIRSGADPWPTEVRRTAQVQVEDIAPDREAIRLDMTGRLEINAATGAVAVTLDNVPAETRQLQMNLIHSVHADRDIRVTLVRGGEQFLGRVDALAGQAWTVQLVDADGSWRISGRLEPGATAARLAPALSSGS